ncbi:penicillin acylase family protein [Tahibacter sp. UC22_41]|uniref:penicillin acylase family protein n=1 Tax=Tahibacter sp. UC22_41 TaxID=3350178 RepID=UPI0036DF5F51
MGTPPTPEDARDYVLLKSMQDGLARFASADFAAAFARSTDLNDYRWGKLHRIVFTHPLGGPFNLPGANPYGFTNYAAALPGVPRSGGFDAVDASSHSTRANGVNEFMFSSGPARRFVGEMSTPISADEVIPGRPERRARLAAVREPARPLAHEQLPRTADQHHGRERGVDQRAGLRAVSDVAQAFAASMFAGLREANARPWPSAPHRLPLSPRGRGVYGPET